MSGGALSILELVGGGGFRSFRGGTVKADTTEVLTVLDAGKLSMTLTAGVNATMVILHTTPKESALEIELMEGARLSVAEVFLCGAFADTAVFQTADSSCDFTSVVLAGAQASYRAELNGQNAGWRFGGLFAGTDVDRCMVALNTRHNVGGCTSESMVKGVVAGRAAGEFRGLVYVAPDAQRTDARQQSRNIELSADAHIVTKPQLEIYADDVKCSHGATVGHRDEEALFYMRQRGLSERDAQRLQIEGFVKEIVMNCPIGAIRETLEAELDRKLLKL